MNNKVCFYNFIFASVFFLTFFVSVGTHANSIPLPQNKVLNSYLHFYEYLNQLSKIGYSVEYQPVKNKAGEYPTEFTLSTKSYFETWQILKILFFIPTEYEFITTGKKYYSTTKKPSEAVKKLGVYNYVTQFLAVEKLPNGILEYTYFNDSEVGGIEITFKKSDKGFVITTHEFSH